MWFGGIEKFDAVTGADLGRFVNTGLNPTGLAFDSAGNLYVANYSGNTIMRFSRDGVGSAFASAGLNMPTQMAFDSKGNLYVANYSNIMKFTPGGVGSVFASTGLLTPWGLAVDSNDNVYAQNYPDRTILKFAPDGTASPFAAGVSSLGGMAFDNAGNLYVTSSTGRYIEAYTPAGTGSVFASTGMNGPKGLAFDSAGNLYAANFTGGGSIVRFAPDGVGSQFATMSANPPVYFAVQVPEPTSLWLLESFCMVITARKLLAPRLTRAERSASASRSTCLISPAIH